MMKKMIDIIFQTYFKNEFINDSIIIFINFKLRCFSESNQSGLHEDHPSLLVTIARASGGTDFGLSVLPITGYLVQKVIL